MIRLNLDDFAAWTVGRYDDYITVRCPFHDDRKPSCLVYSDGWFRCLSCEAHGHHLTLYDALKGHASPRFGRSQPTSWYPPKLSSDPKTLENQMIGAHVFLTENEEMGWYLELRGVIGRVQPCQLGWLDGWCTVPVFDRDGGFEGAMLRASPHITKGSGLRFAQPKGQKPMLYAPTWHRLEDADRLFVVFGIFDALLLSELGLPVVTTTGGRDSFNAEWLADFRRRIVVVPDIGDEPKARQLASELDWRASVVELDYPEGCKDPNDFAIAGKQDQLRAQLTGV